MMIRPATRPGRVTVRQADGSWRSVRVRTTARDRREAERLGCRPEAVALQRMRQAGEVEA